MSIVPLGATCGWETGKHHKHEDRENRAKLYLSCKDHKKDPFKTRPIGTANTSYIRAFANGLSDLLEAIANSEKRK